jgi:hypothetical protein
VQTARAASALQRFYAEAEKPLSVDDIQLGLIEITSQTRADATDERACRSCARAAPISTGARRTRRST